MSYDFLMSNRGACNFLIKDPNGEMRKFELTETYAANGDMASPICFYHFLTTVRGKLCWSLYFIENIVSVEEASIYAECIEEILQEIELE